MAAACLRLSSVAAPAEVRVWTDDLNRAWHGEFLRVDGASASNKMKLGGYQRCVPSRAQAVTNRGPPTLIWLWSGSCRS